MLSILVLILLCPPCPAASNPINPPAQQTTANAPSPQPVEQQGTKTDDSGGSGKHHLLSSLELSEIAWLAGLALFFACLKLVTHFDRYKGLLHVLLWNGYSWIFLVFIAACGFALDIPILSLLLPRLPASWLSHLYIALGHSGASWALAYTSPVLLGRFRPTRAGAVPLPGPMPGEPSLPKKRSEMNIVFAAIHESLEGRVNSELNRWTVKYKWEVLKYVANTLTIDQVSAAIIPKEEGERIRVEVNSYKQCVSDLEDRQQKYELLRKMMSQTSFKDLRTRLVQADI